jgi:hypothetical protein
LLSSETGFCSKAEASTDLPDDAGPRSKTCFEGIDREEETESNIDDHKFSGGASGVAGRDPSMIFVVLTLRRVPILQVAYTYTFETPIKNFKLIIFDDESRPRRQKQFFSGDHIKSYFLTQDMSSTVAVPQHKLSESPNSRAIEINDWVIIASTNPISSASECDALQASLGFPLPEMTFGSNYLSLEHQPSGWKMMFDTHNALKCVKKGELGEGDGGVKVGYADAWLKSR